MGVAVSCTRATDQSCGPTAELWQGTQHSLLRVSLVAILLGACSGGSAPAGLETTVRDSAGVTIVHNRMSEYPAVCPATERLRIGAVNGASEHELYRVFGSARLSDGAVALITNNEVRVYGPDGAFRFAFGGTGGGPGEFPGTAMTLDAIQGDTLVVGSDAPWRFSYFDPNGQYLYSSEPAPQILRVAHAGVFRDGRVLIASPCCLPNRTFEFVDQDLTVMILDRTGKVDTVGAFPFRRWGLLLDGSEGAGRFRDGPLFGHQAIVRPGPDGFVYGPANQPEIQLRSLQARLQRIVRWSPGPPPVTPEDIDAFRESFGMSGRASMARRAMVDPERPVADTFPAYVAIRVAESGDLWALLYPRQAEFGGDRTWFVFHPDGRFRCRVEVPRLFEPAVGRDHIRGALTDELGVEYVVEYKIGRPVP